MSDTTTGVNLTKGQRVDLTKTNPGLNIVHVGLGWDVAKAGSAQIDLDAFALVLAGDPAKLTDQKRLVYFNNKSADGVEHMGDNLTGVGDGDDETVKIDLSKLPADATEVAICVNIYDAVTRKQSFGMVSNAFIRVYEPTENKELMKFDLTEDYSAFNAMIMGKLYKKDGEWKFQAVGEGLNGDINQVATKFQ